MMSISETRQIELLAPAGDPERLDMALTYRADAVYLAGQRFGMRAAAGNFSPDALEQAVAAAHAQGVRVYVTCNTVPRNGEIRALPAYLEQLQSSGADALIVSDLGVLRLAKTYAPRMKLHISTQAGVMNSAAANALYDLGAARVVLAREMTLDEIAQLRSETPGDLELEAFVHGAMCVSFSGRCLLSNYLTGRDANAGACAQPCRWKYSLVEEKRPNVYMDVVEDGGTYILNSRDLCMIGHLRELIDAGVTSMKIEGRMKSAYYAAAATNAYRHALDDVLAGRTPDPVWLEEVNMVSHRPYSTGFYFDAAGPGQHYSEASYSTGCDVVAQVLSCTEDGRALVSQRNKFSCGETLELLTPDHLPVRFTVQALFTEEGEPIDAAPHPTMTVRMQLPHCAPRNAFLRRKR